MDLHGIIADLFDLRARGDITAEQLNQLLDKLLAALCGTPGVDHDTH